MPSSFISCLLSYFVIVSNYGKGSFIPTGDAPVRARRASGRQHDGPGLARAVPGVARDQPAVESPQVVGRVEPHDRRPAVHREGAAGGDRLAVAREEELVVAPARQRRETVDAE